MYLINIINMIFNLFKKDNLKIGDMVSSCENYYGDHICYVTRIYSRKHGSKKDRYCCLEFILNEKIKTINVTYNSCKKV